MKRARAKSNQAIAVAVTVTVAVREVVADTTATRHLSTKNGKLIDKDRRNIIPFILIYLSNTGVLQPTRGIMQIKVDDILTYKDSQISVRYGTGTVTSISSDEYTILWSGRGSTKYKRSILDGKLEQIFQRVDKRAGLPKERHLQLGAS